MAPLIKVKETLGRQVEGAGPERPACSPGGRDFLHEHTQVGLEGLEEMGKHPYLSGGPGNLGLLPAVCQAEHTHATRGRLTRAQHTPEAFTEQQKETNFYLRDELQCLSEDTQGHLSWVRKEKTARSPNDSHLWNSEAVGAQFT